MNGCHYLSIVNDHRSKIFPSLCVVKGSTCFANLDEQGLPLGEIFAQTIVDVLSLHVPQALVLQPHLDKGNKDSTEFSHMYVLEGMFYVNVMKKPL